ncbi:MAG: polysaccharide biosynthesis C-terminal domain-containing protein [Clostridia bacterium]|nr:polysaccharide biosynthesis C-terminal domain-containing protein [Clostridia bacterium]
MSSRIKNTLLNILTSLGGQLLATILKFVTRTVLIHTLGKAYLGINGLFSDILTMLSLTELGLDTAINFKMYKPLAEKDAQRVRVLLIFYKQAYRIIGIIILLLGLCLIPALPYLIKDYGSLNALGIDAVLIFVLYLLQSVSSYLFFAYKSSVMKANQKSYILNSAEYAITVFACIVKIVILKLTKNFVAYTAVSILFVILQNYVNAIISQRYFPEFFIPETSRLSKKEVIGLLKDCGSLFLYKTNVVVVKATDNLVLSSFLSLTAVGLYSNYLLLYNTMQQMLGKLYAAAKASMGNLFATESIETRYQFFRVMNFITILLYGTAGVGISVCSDELIRVWISAEYVIPQPLAILVGLEMILVGLGNNLGQIRNVSGVFRQMWYRPLIGIILNIVVSVALVQQWGINGVVAGTICTLLFTNIAIDPWLIYRYSFNNYRSAKEYYSKNLAYGFVLMLIFAGDAWLCNHFFVGQGWWSVALHVLVVLITVPGIMLLIFGKTDEGRYLMRLINRILSRTIIKQD